MSRPSGLRAKLSTLTIDTVRELRKEIQREHQAKAVASSAADATPKANGSGIRKGKGVGDIGGFLDSLTTPSRSNKGTPTSRLSNTSNNANLPSPSGSFASTPGGFATPSKPSSLGPSGSSYRPGPSKLAPPNVTPGGHSPSSPVSGNESSVMYVMNSGFNRAYILLMPGYLLKLPNLSISARSLTLSSKL